MEDMDLLIIGGLIAFAVVAGIIAFSMMLADPKRSLESRLDVLAGKDPKDEVKQLEILKADFKEKNKSSLVESILPKMVGLNLYFEQADCNIPPATILTISVGLGAVEFIVQSVLQLPFYFVALAPVFASIPWIWVYFKRKKRLDAFSAQLSEALELLGRALRSGQSLVAGLQVITTEMVPPISVEFNKAYERQKLGIAVEDALKEMCGRVPSLDLKFFVTSVAIQRQTGGDLAEILDKIGHIIRERFRIKGQVQALTGEGRMSGTTLLALPIVLFFYMRLTNYDYVSVLWTTDLGQKMLAGLLVGQVVGALVIRKMVDIKV